MLAEKPRSAGQVLLIPNEKIFPNPSQPRRIFNQEELINLAMSIRINGILQPITVREIEKGYELVSGERRLRASKLAGMSVVPCIVVSVNSVNSAIYALIENIQRQNLNYFEEAVAIERLMNEYGFSGEEAAKQLGKATSTISNKLRLLNLPIRAQKMLLENGLSERHARALLRLSDDSVIAVLEKVIEKKMNVSQTEKYIDELLQKNNKPKRITKRMFSDVRIFLNTIKNAVTTMQSAGITAEFKENTTEDSFVYEITIPKNKVYKQK